MSNPITPSMADSIITVSRNILEHDLITEAPFEDYFRPRGTKALVKRIITLKSFMFDNECHMSMKIEHITPKTKVAILNLGDIDEFCVHESQLTFKVEDYSFSFTIQEEEEDEVPTESVCIRPKWRRPDDIPVAMPGPWPSEQGE